MIIVSDDGCMMGTMTPPTPGFIPPTMEENLAQGFDAQTEFFLHEGRPMALWPMWDYAEDWSKHPIREVHPFIPAIYGKEIPEAEFRALVKQQHGIA